MSFICSKFLGVASVVLLSAQAWAIEAAAEVAATPPASNFMAEDFWPNALPILGAIVMAAATLALRALQKKTGIDIDAKTEAALRSAMRSAVLGAEEWAAAKLKAGDPKPDGAEKAARVIELVQLTYPKAKENELTSVLHEELARTKGLGATGNSYVAPPTPIAGLAEHPPDESGA